MEKVRYSKGLFDKEWKVFVGCIAYVSGRPGRFKD